MELGNALNTLCSMVAPPNRDLRQYVGRAAPMAPWPTTIAELLIGFRFPVRAEKTPTAMVHVLDNPKLTTDHLAQRTRPKTFMLIPLHQGAWS